MEKIISVCPQTAPIVRLSAVNGPRAKDRQTAGKKVLVVDEDPCVRLLLRSILKRGAYEVEILEAGDGSEALVLAQRERPSLILLELLLPKMNGGELCRRLKGDPATASIPVVVVTAWPLPGSMTEGSGAVADAQVAKPFSPGKLLDIVEGLLAKGARKDPAPVMA